MAEPKPFLLLLSVQALGLAALTGWWATRPPGFRTQRLLQVLRTEQAATVPPSTLLEQAHWLIAHRAAQLIGVVGLLVLAGLIGLTEGTWRRQRDPQGGFRLTWWTVGIVGLGGLCSLLVLYLCVPWPLPPIASGLGLAGLTLGVSYALAVGRPQIS
jgi:hypothetical protein